MNRKMSQLSWIHSTYTRKCIRLQWVSRLIIYTTICVKHMSTAQQLKVEPPSSIQIDDPGYLGMLDIHWKPPVTVNLYSQCRVLYELNFPSADGGLWRSIRTRQLDYRAAFNFNKEIIVKIRTYLKGSCVNDLQAWSEWIEANFSIPLKGSPDSKIEDFQCIYYDWETLNCTWRHGKQIRPDVTYEFLYWYKGLAEKKSCDSYLAVDGINLGCVFQKNKLGLHTEFFVHVTGTSDLNPIRSSYFILQLQDLVKPGSPEEVTIRMIKANELILEWEPPRGRVPVQCLVYEIHSKDKDDIWKINTEQRETIIKLNSSNEICTRIRAKVNMFCANDGFWSEWSPETCWKEPPSKYPNSQMYYVAGSIIILIFLCAIAAYVAIRTKRHWSSKLQKKAKDFVYEMDASNMLH
ncbi:interleukin-13 receptor subunit alpha-2 [Pelobates fuscus]|uniref:interleukin-13 receptor subunit alpha-2 n=1 Tax=Pelobates fuscus TaxID=191477 RepID=UPI002FE4A436